VSPGAGGRIFKDFQKDLLQRRMLLAARFGLLGAALVAVAALSAYFTFRRSVSGRNVQVPDLTELTVEEAAALLEKSGLVLEEAAQRNDERVAAGRILLQDPIPGAGIKVERKVKVVVSLGDQVNLIPELRGAAARKAQITLQQQGMRLGDQVYLHNRKVGENMVIAQDPLPESEGQRQSRVAVLVSRGSPPRAYVMPALQGRTEAEAMAFLARAGLRAGPVRRDPRSAARPGTVVSHDPPSGYPARAGDIVTLLVAGAEG
jgi:serine/threonine-protein kinase